MRRFLHRVRAHGGPLRYCAVLVIFLVVVTTLLSPVLAPYDPLAQDPVSRLLPAGSPGHLLGTDQFGRDTLSRLIYGARIEIVVAVGATAVALVVGTLLGLLGGFFGRWVEVLTMRATDLILAFPPIILALLVVTIQGPSIGTLIVVIGVLFAPNFARITYGQVVSVKHAEYVDAARALGTPTPRILFRVVLPNVMSPIAVQISLTLAASILLESGLSFLGLGVVPPTPSWGLMVAEGQRYMTSNPEQIIVPSIAVVVTILAFGVLGDALRDWLDPRQLGRSRRAAVMMEAAR